MNTELQEWGILPKVKLRIDAGPGFLVDELDISRFGADRGAPFEMSLFTVDPGGESIAESHEDAELWLVASGNGTMYHGEHQLDLRSGVVVSIEPGIVHKVLNAGDQVLSIFSLWWVPAASTDNR